jgi:tetratricopeptide (TPR) repeat protein
MSSRFGTMRTALLRTLGGLAVLALPLSAVAQPATSPPPARTHPPPRTLDTLASLRAQGHFQAVLSRLTTLKDQYPSNAAVLWRRALILTDLGKTATEEDTALAYYRRALDDADAALRADASTAWPHAIKALVEGRLCLHVGKRERARRSRRVRRHARRALARDSTLALAHHMLGRWHRHVADLNFIERSLAEAIYGGLPDASFRRSVRSLKRALRLEERSYHHLHLGKTYLQMDRDDAARRHLQAALNATGSPLDPVFKSEARRLLDEVD